MNKPKRPDISIVIATYQWVDCLIYLLDSLNCQTVGKEVFEVIVVANTQDEIDSNRVKNLCGRPAYAELELHYIHHPVVGLSAARNRGVAAARADLVGFLDDDSLPEADWVEKVVQIFSETKADIVGGPSEPYYLTSKPHWFRDLYVVTSDGHKACWLTGTKTVIGRNMAWRKQVIVDLGGFSTAFGYVGNKMVLGEDTELNQRARRAGYTTWYDPRLLIQHYVNPIRMHVSWFLSSGFRNGQAKANVYFKEWSAQESRPLSMQMLSQFKSVIANLFIVLGSMLMLPFHSRAKYPYWQNYAIEFIRPRIVRFSMSATLLRLFFSNVRSHKFSDYPPRLGEVSSSAHAMPDFFTDVKEENDQA
jgi:glucosyl-dolichyl phosphate glucuronosyltransferase